LISGDAGDSATDLMIAGVAVALTLLAQGRAAEADAALDAWLETAGAPNRFELCLWLALLPEEVRDSPALSPSARGWGVSEDL
jgi:hypothetical protein